MQWQYQDSYTIFSWMQIETFEDQNCEIAACFGWQSLDSYVDSTDQLDCCTTVIILPAQDSVHSTGGVDFWHLPILSKQVATSRLGIVDRRLYVHTQ